MALHTIALTGTIPSLAGWLMPSPVSGAVRITDVAQIGEGMVDDSDFGTLLQGLSYGLQAVLATGTINGTATVTAVTARGGSPPFSQIKLGDLVLGIGIVPGTFVRVVTGGSTVGLSRAASGTAAGVGLAFVRPGLDQALADITPMGQLFVPGRGVLKVLPGDVVAVDNTGWPILLSAATIAYVASQWTLT